MNDPVLLGLVWVASWVAATAYTRMTYLFRVQRIAGLRHPRSVLFEGFLGAGALFWATFPLALFAGWFIVLAVTAALHAGMAALAAILLPEFERHKATAQ